MALIKLKKSVVPSRVPTTLEYGELALNYNDGRLYFKRSDGSASELDSIQSFSASYALNNITNGISTPEYIDFNTLVTTTPQEGRIWWDNQDGNKTLNIGMSAGVVQQVGEEVYYRVRASSAITNGQVVMATGTVGNSGTITAAPAAGLTADTAIYVMGVATQDIASGEFGYITKFGLVRQINTLGGAETWQDGTVLYLDPTQPGKLTKYLPTAPAPKVVVAMVVHAHTSGSIFVRVSHGSVLGGTDGNVQITNPQDEDRLVYNGSLQRWENKPLVGTGLDQIISLSKSITLGLDWQDTGIQGTDLPTGTYIVQLFANDIYAGGVNNDEYYSGTMSWYSGTTNTSVELPTDEIVLHRAGASSDAGMYLRTFREENGVLKLQIYSNIANPSAANYVFKFRKMI